MDVDGAKDGQVDFTDRRLLDAHAQTNKSASIAERARAALETQSSGGKAVRTGTAAPSVAFPLTPTSAAGETSDRTMASLTAAAAVASAASAVPISEGRQESSPGRTTRASEVSFFILFYFVIFCAACSPRWDVTPRHSLRD